MLVRDEGVFFVESGISVARICTALKTICHITMPMATGNNTAGRMFFIKISATTARATGTSGCPKSGA